MGAKVNKTPSDTTPDPHKLLTLELKSPARESSQHSANRITIPNTSYACSTRNSGYAQIKSDTTCDDSTSLAFIATLSLLFVVVSESGQATCQGLVMETILL